MRIGIDATCWHNRRGYGRHARGLLSALVPLDQANRYTLFLDSDAPAQDFPPGCEIRVLKPAVPTVQAAAATGHRSVSDMWRMSRALSLKEFDAILFPTIYSYVPAFSRARKLVIVHDVIAEIYPSLTIPRRMARFLWNTKTRLGRMQADALITVSDYSREKIVERFHLDRKRVFVVGEAPDRVFRRLDGSPLGPKLRAARIDPSRRIVVYVGGFSPHKNLETLLDAFACIAMREEFRDVRLVMVGATSGDAFYSYYGTIAKKVEAAGLQERVIFTGYLDDEELVMLLNIASVLTLPSLMEGYGLPAVEAAACGCPVIATRASPLAALLGEGGLFIDPTKEAIMAALQTVLGSEDLRLKMRQGGLRAAQRLTWEQAARQMIAVIRKVCT